MANKAPIGMVQLRMITVQALIDTIVGRPGSTLDEVADVIGALGGADFKAFQQLLDGLAGRPNASVADAEAAWRLFASEPRLQELLDGTVGAGSTVADFVKAWEDLLALVAGGGGLGSGLDNAAVGALIAAALAALPPAGVDEPAVNDLIATALANLPVGVACPVDEDAVKTLIGDALAAFIMPILQGHTADIGSLQTDLASVRGIVVGLVNDLSDLPLGADVQPLLDLLAVKPGATIADVEAGLPVLIQTIVDKRVELFTALIENLHEQITGGVEQINGATGEPINHAIVVGSWLLKLADLIANVEKNVMAFGNDLVDLRSGLPGQIGTAIDASVTSGAIGAALSDLYSQLYNGDIVPLKDAVNLGFPEAFKQIDALKAAVAALQVLGGGGGEGMTPQQAQLLASTAADLNAIITGITGIFTTSPNPEGVVNTIRRINKDAETGSKIASALLGGFLGKPITQLGSNEQEALQAIVDWCANFKRIVDSQGSSIAGILTDLDTANTNVQDLSEVVVPLRDTVELHGDRITTLEGAALGGGEGVSQAVVDSLLARLDALEAENATLTGQVLTLQKQDEDIVEFMSTKLVTKDWFESWEGSVVNIIGSLGTQIQGAEKLIADVMNAMNGPTATVESIKEMFWLLNDIIEALIEATGIEIAGRA